MKNKDGPGKRIKLSEESPPPRKGIRSRTVSEASQEAVNKLLFRHNSKTEYKPLDIGLCGTSLNLLEDERARNESEVEWEDEDMYVYSTSKELEIDFQTSSKRKSCASSYRLTKAEKEHQKVLGKVYILCMFGKGLVMDKVSDNLFLQSLIYSILPCNLVEKLNSGLIDPIFWIVNWFDTTFTLRTSESFTHVNKRPFSLETRIFHDVIRTFQKKEGTIDMLNIILVALLKTLEFQTRTVHVLDYVNNKKTNWQSKKQKAGNEEENKMDPDPASNAADCVLWKQQCWCEYWHERKAHSQWKPVDFLDRIYVEPYKGQKSMESSSIEHVVAFYGGGAQDVGPRYINNISQIQKHRNDSWWMSLLKPFKQIMFIALDSPSQCGKNVPSKSKMTLEEEEFKAKIKFKEDIKPRSIDDFKKSLKYILDRHITKFKGVVPTARIQGNHNGEPYYLRTDVEELHSVVKWPHQGREVKQTELSRPHKIVKKRVQSKRKNDEIIPTEEEQEEEQQSIAATTELYGYWQTKPWKRPKAENGIVPRNSFGNVEVPPLVKDLPKNTVYLKLPNVGRVCRLLGVDFAPALVGFDIIRGGRQVPKLEGIVISAENIERVTKAYWESVRLQQEAKEKEIEEVAKSGWKALLSAICSYVRLHQQYGGSA